MRIDPKTYTPSKDIWHVDYVDYAVSADSISIDGQLRLWPMEPGKFMVNEAGSYAPVLVNALYTLVHKKYAEVFRSLEGQVQVVPAVIHDYLRKTENHDYVELHIQNKIFPTMNPWPDPSGLKVWTYDGHLFVSGDLKAVLEPISNGELKFHGGFQWFG